MCFSSNLELKLNTEDNRFLSKFWNQMLIESKDTTINMYLSYKDTLLTFDLIDDVEYSISFLSKFKHSIDTTIRLTSSVFIQFSELNTFYSPQEDESLFLTKMNIGDTVHVFYEVRGCFDYEYGFVEIIKNRKGFRSYLYVSFMGEKRPKHRKMGEQQVDLLLKFENDLRSHDEEGWCSITTYYALELNKTYYSRSDNSCGWFGYESLLSDVYNYE